MQWSIAGPDDRKFLYRGPSQDPDGLILGCVVDERDVVNKWRHLFTGTETTSRSLRQAAALLDGLSGESPLHIRLAKELEELRQLHSKK
jgi:putative heme degradation protein